MIRHYAEIELRTEQSEEMRTEGVACVFDKETDLGWFYEKIDRHAFDDCDMSDVYLLFNHDPNYVLARTLNGSLELSVTDKGLNHKSTIVETQQGRDIYNLVKSGVINKMSFAFSVNGSDGDEWETDSDGAEHRTIKKIDRLYDVSLVTYPAYAQTNAFARSLNDLDDLAKEHLEKRGIVMDENKEPVVEQETTIEPIEERQEEIVEAIEEPIEEKAEEIAEEEKVEEPKQEEPVEQKEEERSMNTNFENVSVESRDYLASQEYRSAWVKSVIGKGDAELNAIKEARGLSTTSATLVPTYIADKIEATWEKNKLVAEVSKVFSTAKLSFPIETANSGAGFHVEGAEAPAEEEITLVDKLLQPMMIKKWISITDELIASGDVAIMDYIAEEVVYYINKAVNNAIVNGTLASGKGVEGIVNSSLANSVNAGTLDATTFYKGLATLVDVEEPVVVMNPADFYGKVMALLDTTGAPIFSVLGAEKYVNGCRVILQASVPTNKAIIGDLSAYKLELGSSAPVILHDPYTSAREDKEIVVGKLLCAGALVKPNKVAVVTFTA